MKGNPEYVPTTDDVDFIEKLKARQWSVIYFAPGACRFSAVKRAIPGSNVQTKSWTLEEYRDLVRELQGDSVKIVESLVEEESLALCRSYYILQRENFTRPGKKIFFPFFLSLHPGSKKKRVRLRSTTTDTTQTAPIIPNRPNSLLII